MMRQRWIQVRVSEEEHAQIAERARERGLSVSDYLRQVALHDPPSVTSVELGRVQRRAAELQHELTQLVERPRPRPRRKSA